MLRRAGALYCRGARGVPRHDAYAGKACDWDIVTDEFAYGVEGIDVVLCCRAERVLRERHNCPDHRRGASERHRESRPRRCMRRN